MMPGNAAAVATSDGLARRWTGRFGGRSIGIEADAATATLLAALPPPEPIPVAAPDLSIRFESGAPDPRDQADPAWRVHDRWARSEQLRVRGDGGTRMIFDPFSRSVVSLGDGAGRIWFDTAQAFAPWVAAAPALQLLDWWGTPRGLLATHGAAVSFGGAAAVLLGPGGSGKSTFAVEAAERGHGFLGDDYVLVEPGFAPRVHALYRTAKLGRERGDALRRFSRLAEGEPGDDKDVFIAAGADVVRSAPIVAMIAPAIGAGSEPRLAPIGPADLVRRAAPSILRQMPGLEAEKLALLSRAARALPCYRLDLCRDHGRNIGAVETLVAAGAGPHG
ncbi:hypothetical protein [Sphingomonas sp. YL-JM2C]